MHANTLPLQGLRVIEWGTHAAVPNAARCLADWGAEVIKVEGLSGDTWRVVGRNNLCKILDDENPFFSMSNANKKLIALNLKNEMGKEAMLKLLDTADVFLTNVRMASVRRLGLDYDAVAARNPKIIYGHFTGYGYEGPDAGEAGLDTVTFWGRSGAMVDWSDADGAPFWAPTAAGDTVASMNMCCGILAGLMGRERNGIGTFVSTSLYSSTIWVNGFGMLGAQAGNPFPKKHSEPSNPFGWTYECKDHEWLIISILDYQKYYPDVMRILGLDDLVDDERFSKIDEVKKHYDEFMPRLCEAFKQKTRDEWMPLFKAKNLVCGGIYHLKNIADDPQAIANRYVVPITYPTGSTIMMPTVPVQFSAYDTTSRYDVTGAIGRDTDAVLEQVGYTKEQLEKGRQEGALK